MDICCAYFRGEFHLKKYGDENAPFLPVGNVSAFTINHEVTNVVQEDFTALGGNACSIDYISAATVNMTLDCLKKENLAIALQGTATELDQTNVTGETHTVLALGSLIPLAFIPQKSTVVVNNDEAIAVTEEEHEVDALDVLIPLDFIPNASSIVVTDNTSPTPTTFVLGSDYTISATGITPITGGNITTSDTLLISYTYNQTFVEGIDYIVTSAGIVVLDGGSIAVDDVISVSYTYGTGSKVEGITTGQQVYELIFDGVNYGEDGEQEVVARIWRIKFAPAATLALLTSGEFATIEIVGTLLKDDTKIGTGVSKYYNFESRDIA